MRILIVEDELKVAEVLKRGLTEEGYETDQAFDGQIGLRMALGGGYDLILLDVNLPLMNGLELCKKLREQDEATPASIRARMTIFQNHSASMNSTHESKRLHEGVKSLILLKKKPGHKKHFHSMTCKSILKHAK
jgi:CheY-like chemotaxis protein